MQCIFIYLLYFLFSLFVLILCSLRISVVIVLNCYISVDFCGLNQINK